MKIRKITFATLCVIAAASVSAQNRSDLLWVLGDATPYEWKCDEATALLSTDENHNVFTGTMYLEANKNFKFLTKYDFGNMEYRAAEENATPDADGKLKLVLADSGNDYQIHVGESANYLITVDAQTLEATIVKSAYQETEVRYASLFIVGSVLSTGYSVDQGLAMVQDAANPLLFRANKASFLEGSFKIATALKGAGSWNPQYWYFRDVNDDTKIVLNAEGDNQWSITDAGKYNVEVNLADNSISILEFEYNGVEINFADPHGQAVYYTIDGRKIDAPVAGSVLIRIDADGTATKVRF